MRLIVSRRAISRRRNIMPKVTLYISRAENQPGHYLVVVDGEGFYNAVGAQVAARIRGDDPLFDNSLFSIGTGGFNHVAPGGIFNLSTTVPGSKLNEDWGRDEIYAFADVAGHGTFRSNTVTGYF